MTKLGTICMLLLMAAALIGILIGAARKTPKARRASAADRAGGQALREVPAEPVVFRTGDLRFVTCKASCDAYDTILWDRKYAQRELACILAEQALAGGGIAFEEQENVLRATMRVVIPEGGADDA